MQQLIFGRTTGFELFFRMEDFVGFGGSRDSDVTRYEYALKVHHGATFQEKDGDLVYVGGHNDIWDVNPDFLSGIVIVKIIE